MSSIDSSVEDGFKVVLSKKNTQERKIFEKNNKNLSMLNTDAAYNNVREMIVSVVGGTDPTKNNGSVPVIQSGLEKLVSSPAKSRRYSVGTWKHSSDQAIKSREVQLSPPLEMEASARKWGDKQFAVSTIQATTDRPKGSRKVRAPARLGNYLSGKKGRDTSVGASTLSKVIEATDDDDGDLSDNMYVGHIPPDKASAGLIPGKSSLLRPGEVEDIHDQPSSMTDDEPWQLQAKDVAKKAKSYFNTGQGSCSTLPAPVEHGTQELISEDFMIETNLMKRKRVASNAESRKIPRGTGQIETEQEERKTATTTVEPSAVEDVRLNGHNSVLFYAFVDQKDHKQRVLLDYIDPPVHEDSVLHNENMSPEDFVLKSSITDTHFLSQADIDTCVDSVAYLKFIYLHRHFFHNIYSYDAAILLVQEFHYDKHLFLVIMGGALTNYLWSMTNDFQMDKEKFVVALRYCENRYGTFTVSFDRIPLSRIRLEHLFLLPIRTIMAYIHHHGVVYRSIPWIFKPPPSKGQEDKVLTGLQNMPVETAPPFAQLAEYLSALMTYLNHLMEDEASSYAIIYTQFQRRAVSLLTHTDAATFIGHHFPLEASRLRDDSDMYHLLERAVDFAFDIYHVGDIKEQCSQKWMFFIHYLLYGTYPAKHDGEYNTDQCIKALLKLNVDQDNEEPPDLRRLLAGPHHLLMSFLKNNYRAKRLYGASVERASQGIHRLMASGVVLQWYMEYSKKNDVDDHIRSGDLCHMLHTMGVLAPTEHFQPQFSSVIVPVHTLGTAETGVLAVVKSGMTVAILPPKHFTNPNPSDQDYREYYNSHIKASMTERIELQFHRTSNYITDFSTSPCLFPLAIRPIVDVAVVNRSNYIWLEGQRMVGIVKAAVTRQIEEQQQRDLPKPRNNKDKGHPSPLKQTTLQYTAGGQLGLVNTHQPKIVSMAQLQAIRKARQAFSDYVSSERLTSDWSSYDGSEIAYMNQLDFHVVQERVLVQHDDLVLLFHDSSDTKDTGHILGPTHVHYRIVNIAGSVVHLDFVTVLHTNHPRRSAAEDIPIKLTIIICNEYILLRSLADGHQQPNLLADLQSTDFREAAAQGSGSGSTILQRTSQGNRSTMSESRLLTDSTGGGNSHHRPIGQRASADVHELLTLGRQVNRSRHQQDDERSEDSDTRRHTKTSIIKVGLSEVEVLGKHAVHDDILRTTAVRTLMEKDRMKKFITAAGHGYFGNNFTEKNIIQGMLKYDSMGEDSTTLYAKLHASVNHNRVAVTKQAWYKHPELHKKIALCDYEQGHEVSPHSIQCAHFLPAEVAASTNYQIDSWDRYMQHLEGMKQVFQELLGPSYGITMQTIITDARENRIGEMNNIVFLTQLTHLWRSELCRYAKSMDPFVLPNNPDIYHPASMTSAKWQDVILVLWSNLKADLNLVDEMVYMQGLTAKGIELPKAFGHKAKQKAQAEKAPVDNKKKPSNQRKAKSQGDKHSPRSDTGDALCVADLLSHYGSSQQIACDIPCKYPHYNSIASGVTKAAVIKKVQFLAPRLQLAEGTVGFLRRKVEADKKFR